MNKNMKMKIVSSMVLGSMCLCTSLPVLANTKEETVYSKLNNCGINYSTIVSEKISNDDSSELIKDISDLLNIKNTSGDETFEKNGNELVWKVNGNKIEYQGTIEKDEPITCTIKYELNGEEIEAKDIVGKSGKVKITLDYKNNDVHTVKINGKYEKMYTPFVVVAGTLIDGKVNKNVKVTNGKVLDNGNKVVALGMCLPGLQESLNISKNKVKIPTTIEFSMDAEDFEMNNIISYATPKLVSEADLNMFDNLDDIYAQANELQDASNQIVEGTSKLNEGAKALNEGANALNKGTNEALNGVKLIANKVKLSTKGLLSDKSDALKKEQVAAIGNAAAKKAAASVNEQSELINKKAAAGIEENSTLIKEQAIASAKQIAEQTALATALEVKKQAAKEAGNQIVLAAGQTAEETAESVFMGVKVQEVMMTNNLTQEQAILAIKSDEQAQNTLNTIKAKAKKEAVEKAKAKLASSSNVALTEEEKKEIIKKADAGIEIQKETIEAQGLASAKQIATKTAQTTATTVAQMVGQQVGQTVASEVANQVKAGALSKVASSMTELTNGLEQLENGLEKLSDGTQELANGTEQITAGTEELAEGMNKFNKEGINRITDLINGKVKNLETRLKALKDLAKDYKSFAGINEKDNGTVTFITTIDSLKKENFENK